MGARAATVALRRVGAFTFRQAYVPPLEATSRVAWRPVATAGQAPTAGVVGATSFTRGVAGHAGAAGNGGNGGNGSGGALYATGGSLLLVGATLPTNTARGGNAGAAGNAGSEGSAYWGSGHPLDTNGGNGGSGGSAVGGVSTIQRRHGSLRSPAPRTLSGAAPAMEVVPAKLRSLQQFIDCCHWWARRSRRKRRLGERRRSLCYSQWRDEPCWQHYFRSSHCRQRRRGG